MGSLSIAATGMLAQQLNVDVIANNIANLNTTAFKRQRPEFVDLLYQTEIQVGSTTTDGGAVVSGAEFGTGVTIGSIYRIHAQGNMLRTGNNFDLAIEGKGFFQIQAPDGTTTYVRGGAFQIGPTGTIVTSQGLTVQPGITIPSDALEITINNSGEVLVKIAGLATPTNVGQLQLATFPNEAGLKALGNSLFEATAASSTGTPGAPGAAGFGTIRQGFLETSNVNMVSEITSLIAAQRAYELNSKVLQSSDEMLSTLVSTI